MTLSVWAFFAETQPREEVSKVVNVFSALAAEWPMWTSTVTTTQASNEAAATAREQSNSSSTTFDPRSSLGKDDFLRLLVTQLTYQDPINPVNDQEFIAQLAQFSSLEQMHNVAEEVKRLADIQLITGGLGQAASLLGRTVVLFDADTGETVEGVVQSVRLEDNVPTLVVDGRRFSLFDIVEVRGSE